MRVDRGAVRATILVILAVMVLSGPLVPAVDFTRAENVPEIGAGTVRLSVESVPAGGVRFERTRFGSGRYALRVPDAVVRVYAVRGHPTVVYRIDIPSLGYAYASTRSVSDRRAGWVNLSLAPAPVNPQRIDRGRYDGRITIAVRDGSGHRVRHRANVTIGVRG